MDAEIKQKWVTALRSGEYRQGKGRLRNGDKFCCLGVLCMVAEIPIDADGEGCDGMDWRPLRNIIGVNAELPPLWTRNDDGVPFSQIADYIEANL